MRRIANTYDGRAQMCMWTVGIVPAYKRPAQAQSDMCKKDSSAYTPHLLQDDNMFSIVKVLADQLEQPQEHVQTHVVV